MRLRKYWKLQFVMEDEGMNNVDDKIKVLIGKEDLEKRIAELGEQISRDYAGKELHLICILKGGVMFMTELSKHISCHVSMDFMSVSSYGNERESTGRVRILKDLDEPIEGREVLIVEDIIDSGRTLKHLMEVLAVRKPASLKLCTMLDKPDRREVKVKVDYVGFQIPDKFVLGYGLDYDQFYRNIPYIAVVQ